MNKKYALRAAVGASALALAVFSTAYAAEAGTPEPKAKESVGAKAKLSHSQAAGQLNNAGIGIRSSGGCSDRNNPTCTSLDQVNSASIQGAITLKGASKCDMTVTGGTETGHADGQFSHWNGFKLDFADEQLPDQLRQEHLHLHRWQQVAVRLGEHLLPRGNHWDVTFHNCGGCLKGGKPAEG